jgi:hypothetical protein
MDENIKFYLHISNQQDKLVLDFLLYIELIVKYEVIHLHFDHIISY